MTDDVGIQTRPGRLHPPLLCLLAAALALTACQGLNPFMDCLYPVYNNSQFFSWMERPATHERSQAVDTSNTDSVVPRDSANTQTADGEAPRLQPASNGTIGPKGSDATVIQGVNTAGTMRLSNLANFEALLNIIARSAQFLGMSLAILMGLEAIRHGGFRKLSKAKALLLSGGLCVSAFILPTIASLFVAFLRHLNLFC